jgi:hypothetical protein
MRLAQLSVSTAWSFSVGVKLYLRRPRPKTWLRSAPGPLAPAPEPGPSVTTCPFWQALGPHTGKPGIEVTAHQTVQLEARGG